MMLHVDLGSRHAQASKQLCIRVCVSVFVYIRTTRHRARDGTLGVYLATFSL